MENYSSLFILWVKSVSAFGYLKGSLYTPVWFESHHPYIISLLDLSRYQNNVLADLTTTSQLSYH